MSVGFDTSKTVKLRLLAWLERLVVLAALGLLAGACSTQNAQSEPSGSLRALPQQTSSASERADVRAMWLWSEEPSSKAILEDRDGAQRELLEFLRAPHEEPERAINRLFFEARGYKKDERLSRLREVTYDPLREPDGQEKLRRFLRRAHAQGVEVEYLDGQAIWLASDENVRVPIEICQDVVAFNLATDNQDERFDGVHFDIEPHTVTKGPHKGKWWQNRLEEGYNARWTARWQEIFASCRTVFDEYEEVTGERLTLAADLGADFAHYNKPMHAFFDRKDAPTDYVVLMNYYDNRPNRDGQPSFFFGDYDGSEVVGGVEQNLRLWKHAPVLFAVETGPEKIAADRASFHQEGRTKLYQTLDELVDKYGTTNCSGVAIHHYAPNAYRALKP